MPKALPTLTGGQGRRPRGVVAGFVTKLARSAAGLTQQQLAERLGVDTTTIQGWESGRRAVGAMNATQVVRLGHRLSRLGAPASTGRHLRDAVEADWVLSTAIAAGTDWVDPDVHPLAGKVHRRSTTNLITWPLSGVLPPQLGDFAVAASRRGPSAHQPWLGVEERFRFFDHLLITAQRATRVGEALLARQAVYLLGLDQRPHVADWLYQQWQRAARQCTTDTDIVRLLEARSASVALAVAGDSSHLHDFVETTTGQDAQIANLNYWAYWLGEITEEHHNDEFMLRHEPRSWYGHQLLGHLLHRLQPNSPHLPLNLATLHALIASRPILLSAHPHVRHRIGDVLDTLSSGDHLTATGRDHVTGLAYALRVTHS